MSTSRARCLALLLSLLIALTACAGTTAADKGDDPAGARARQPLEEGAPLKVGMMFSSDQEETIKQAGGESQVADRQVIHDALVTYVNEAGGIAGHPVEVVHHDFSAGDTSQVISQGACTQWAQDDAVFAALPSASAQDNQLMRTCLSDAGVLTLYAGSYSSTREEQLAESPLWFEPNTLPLEQWATTYVEGLVKQGFFEGAKVGLLYDQYPEFTSVAKTVLLPALRKAGAKVVATFVGNVHSPAELSSGATEMANAVLKFKDAGVTHVLFFNAWAPTWILFAQAADQQTWSPVYGLSSQDVPQASFATGLVPYDQLRGARLVGWNSIYDVRPGEAGTWPREQECRKIFTDAKLDVESFGAESFGPTMAECGALLILRDAGERVDGDVSPASLAAAVESLGSDLASTGSSVAKFGEHRHFGPAAWRPANFADTCKCFAYTGEPNGF